jgi:hypothetical protein
MPCRVFRLSGWNLGGQPEGRWVLNAIMNFIELGIKRVVHAGKLSYPCVI